jgi:hypothetical protein
MNGTVGVYSDHENVAFAARGSEVTQVTDVQQIEDAVGQHDPSTGGVRSAHLCV